MTLISSHGSGHSGLVAPATIPRLAQGLERYPVLDVKDVFATKGILGLRLTEEVRALAGQPVRLRGYMAPPIAERDRFFVLTASPAIACPFCEPGMRWPDDIVPVLLERDTGFVDPSETIEVVGLLEVGRRVDARTGAERLARLRDARWQPLSR